MSRLLPTRLVEELQATGLPWSVEYGSRHIKVFLDGQMVTVVSKGNKQHRAHHHLKNTVAQIRRAARS